MPTYINNTSIEFSINGVFFPLSVPVEVNFVSGDTRLTKTLDTPYIHLVTKVTTIVATGAENNGVGIVNFTSTLRVQNGGSAVVIRANSASNTEMYPVPAYTTIDIDNKSQIEDLFVEFTSSGTCSIIEMES